MLCSEDAVADPAATRGAVRALCAADIVIADVTGYDPSLLLLLGIRAAVRRSVTLACTQEALSLWEDLPFNLKELNLVSLHNTEDGQEELVGALRAGLAQSGVSGRYLDLPVYDYIREDSAEDATVDSTHVLLLRAFKSYDSARKLHVEKRIHSGLGLSGGARVESVIDQTSPRLAGQRLYEAIRHWKTCVVDLTWWRPNVLFELGVRLAVRANRTFCLIDKSVQGDETYAGSRAQLSDLLKPFPYDLSTSSFTKGFAAPVSEYIYETATRHFRTMQDHYGKHVDTMLVAAAAVTPGHDDPLQAVDITPLYARDNHAYGEEVRHSVFERLCAAWYYLADREEPHAVRPIDLLDRRRAEAFRRFRRLGSRLKAGLAHRYEQRDRRLRQRIEDTERRAKDSGAASLAELLDAWRTLRDDPPWSIDVAKVADAEWAGIVADCENQLEQLAALEGQLEDLANPVCELPLQGIRADRERLEAALQQFRLRIPNDR